MPLVALARAQGTTLTTSSASGVPVGIIQKPHLHLAPLEQAPPVPLLIAVEQPRVHADPAVALARASPVSVAAADRAMVLRNHPVAPDVGHRLALDPNAAVVRIIG